MDVDVLTGTVISRPLSVVAGYAADPGNAPSWYANIRSVEWLTEPPVATGSQVAFVAQFLGRRLAYNYEVLEYVPDVRMVMRTAQGPFPMETTYTWERVGDFTRMTLRNCGSPRGFGSVTAPLMAVAMRCANRADLAGLARVLGGSVARPCCGHDARSHPRTATPDGRRAATGTRRGRR